MTLKLWLALAGFAACWAAAIPLYIHLIRKVRVANLAALRAASVPGWAITGGPGCTFGCPHLTISGVQAASCGQCGPLSLVR